ncbi:uncharacterized protein ACIB01_010318 isoform 1-T1 [Guaruba guarouba]
MERAALLLLASLAPVLAFPTAAPGTTASYLEGTITETTGFTQSFTEEGITKILDEVTTSGSRGRRSEYIAEYDSMTEEDYMTDEPGIISTEQHVQKRTSVEHSISLNEGSVIGDPCEFLFLSLLGLLWFGLDFFFLLLYSENPALLFIQMLPDLCSSGS